MECVYTNLFVRTRFRLKINYICLIGDNMSTTVDFIEYVCDQIKGTGLVRYKKRQYAANIF